MTELKVAFDHGIFSRQKYGGISRYFIELASRLLTGAGVQVVVVAPLHINHYLSRGAVARRTRGLHIPFTFRGLPRLIRLANRLAEPVAWAGVRADVIHETYFAEHPTGSARSRIVTVHDMIYELFPQEFPDAAKIISAKRAAVARADHVICVSEKTREDLVRLYGLDRQRTSVVHLGHSFAIGDRDQRALGQQGRPTLLYVGVRRGYKNFRTLLHAYAMSEKLKQDFDLIAFGDAPFSPAELEEQRRLGVAESVRHQVGDDEALAKRYQTATVFVYPSLYEGFGIPPLEAMSSGCPVVCSDRASIPEVVGDAGLYFDPTNVEELRAVLERVATDESLRTQMRSRGYTRVAAFSWDACASATAQIYRNVC